MTIDLDIPWRIIPAEERNGLPELWRGFDLREMKRGDRFVGCEKCGVQMRVGYVPVNQCPNCIGKLDEFVVTEADVRAAALVKP